MDQSETAPNFRELRSPLTDAMLRPLDADVERIQIPKPLAERDLAKAAAFVARHPETWVRLYNGTDKPWTLDFLAAFPGLRCLDLDFTDNTLTDMAALAAVTPELKGLSVPVTKGTKQNLEALARFSSLETLTICGKIGRLDFLEKLPRLGRLQLDKVELEDLAALRPLSRLAELYLSRAKVKSLDGIEHLAQLAELTMIQVKGLTGLGPARRCPQLRTLDIRLCQIAELLDLEGFTQLERLCVIGEPPKLSLSALWKCASLRRLELHGYEDQVTEKTLKALGRHPMLERVFLGYMDTDERLEVSAWAQVPCVPDPSDLDREVYVEPPRSAGSDDEDGEDADEEDLEREEAIQARVEQAIKGKCLVQYSAYDCDARGMPIDNLDQIAWEGRCRLVGKTDPAFGEGKDYESPVLENPTWLEVARRANDMIKTTGDRHHVFLEGLDEVGDKDGVTVLEVSMGS